MLASALAIASNQSPSTARAQSAGPSRTEAGVSALAAPQNVDQPGRVLGSVAEYIPDLSSARKVGSYQGRDWYLARGADKGLCLIAQATDGSTSGVCKPVEARYSGGLWMATEREDHKQVTALVVPDGFTDAAARDSGAEDVSDVHNNVVFVLQDGDIDVQVRGPNGAALTQAMPDLVKHRDALDQAQSHQATTP
jgi:hypothetical protein